MSKIEAWAIQSPSGSYVVNVRRMVVPADPIKECVLRAIAKCQRLGWYGQPLRDLVETAELLRKKPKARRKKQ